MDTSKKRAPWWVVKVGGSLFARPGLGSQLHAWLEKLPTRRVLLVPGGGQVVEALRLLDQRQQLGEEAAHWLAIGGMALMARALTAMLPKSSVIEDLADVEPVWARQMYPVLVVEQFLRRDEAQENRLPHTWAVTSDSIAARVAAVHGAAKLVLLKSGAVPVAMNMAGLAELGIVDAWFPRSVTGMSQVEVCALPDVRP